MHSAISDNLFLIGPWWNVDNNYIVVGVLYLGYHRPLVIAQNSRYDRFPPAVDSWGTKHPVTDMVLPLLGEEEGPPT
jgi:hypothetical protein